MLKTMSNTPLLIQNLNTELRELHKNNDWKQIQRVVLSVVKLLDREVTISNNSLFNLFTDSDGKIRANASWFFEDTTLADRKATYKVNPDNSINLDFKLYGLNKPSKRTISWVQALTPNFEDEPFNSKFSIGIDFIVPKSLDKVIVVLSNNYVVRTLELKGELTVTYQEIFDKWLKIQDFSNKKEVHNILWESFDLQPLNKKFYAGISERFLELRQHLINNKILDEKHSSMFSNRLIGRVIFCWFLDKKEILNPENKYFDSKSYSNSTEYYKERLEKLFFEILNTPIEDRKYPDKLTPFLNGGLFEPRENDLYQDSKLNFPVNFFDSLFSFLSGYNFTTDESTSQFQQVAIDPEMLGRIFENLLAEINEDTGEQARKAKGAFYTPREIVDFMCKESLKEYLKTKLPEDEFRDQRLKQLIDAPDKDFQDQDHNWRRDWKPYKDQILKALDELKVIDIACGSGAFPIGMMQLLLRVYERLEARFDPYKTKLQIIEQNIFGVDIEPMAVEIARLRAWLSIVVDEESDSKNIKPLPNLEFKFVCANSLISLDSGKNETQTFFDDPYLGDKLQKIRDSYFKTEDLKKKKKLREEYSALVDGASSLFGESKRSKQLKTYRPFDNENSTEFFNSEFMFGVEAFDIVIGNPPYVRQEKIKFKDSLKKEFQIYTSTADLYTYFYERGYLLIKQNGILSFITSNKFTRALYGENLRKYLKENGKILRIINFGNIHVFEAITNTLILEIQKNCNSSTFYFSKSIENPDSLEFNQADLRDSEWTIEDSYTIDIKTKIEKNGIPLKHWNISINYGIKTGYNTAFLINKQQKEMLISEDPNSSEIIKPVIRGRDIQRYSYLPTEQYIILTHNGFRLSKGGKKAPIDINNYPAVKKHLDRYKSKLKERGDKGITYYNLRDCAFMESFLGEKIIWLELTNKNKFAYSKNEDYILAGAFMLTGENLKYLLAFLNSRLCFFYFSLVSNSSGMDTIQWKKFALEKIPVPQISREKQQVFVDLVDLILERKISGQDTTGLEHDIDNKIYEIYDLGKDEISTIESFLR